MKKRAKILEQKVSCWGQRSQGSPLFQRRIIFPAKETRTYSDEIKVKMKQQNEAEFLCESHGLNPLRIQIKTTKLLKNYRLVFSTRAKLAGQFPKAPPIECVFDLTKCFFFFFKAKSNKIARLLFFTRSKRCGASLTQLAAAAGTRMYWLTSTRITLTRVHWPRLRHPRLLAILDHLFDCGPEIRSKFKENILQDQRVYSAFSFFFQNFV